MAKPLIQFLSEVSGDCCQWHFMEGFRSLTNKAAADKIGISERTISETRSMIKDGALACRRHPNCKKGKV